MTPILLFEYFAAIGLGLVCVAIALGVIWLAYLAVIGWINSR